MERQIGATRAAGYAAPLNGNLRVAIRLRAGDQDSLLAAAAAGLRVQAGDLVRSVAVFRLDGAASGLGRANGGAAPRAGRGTEPLRLAA